MKEIVFRIEESDKGDAVIEVLKGYILKSVLHCQKHKLAVIIVEEREESTLDRDRIMCILARFDRFADVVARDIDLTEDLNDLRN